MVRSKFLVFALLVLGLGAAHLPLVSGPLSARAVEGASAPSTAALSEVARALEGRRAVLLRTALALASSSDVAAAVQPQVEPLPKGKGIRIVEPPTAERFDALRRAAAELTPEPLKGSLVLGLVTNEGALYAQAQGKPSADETFNVRALLSAGAEGTVVDAFGAPHVFFSVPVLWNPEGGRPDVGATLVVGAPLMDAAFLDAAALSSGVAALAVLQGDKVLGVAGSQRELVDVGRKALIVGQSGSVVQRGGVRLLLPQLSKPLLPIFTSGHDTWGGEAPLALGSRQLVGPGLEAVAVTSVQPFMTALADYQQNAVFGLMGLVGLSLVWMLVMGTGAKAAAQPASGRTKDARPEPVAAPVAPQHVAPPAPVEPAYAEPPSAGVDDFPFPAAPPPAEPEPYMSAPPVPAAYEAAPRPGTDAFPFPSPAVQDPFATPTVPGKQQDPFATPTVPGKDPFAALGSEAFPFPSSPPVSAAPRKNAFDFEDHPTAAYSLQQAADPFAAAAAQAGLQPSAFGDEDEAPETTRVATVPRELLARSARPMTGEVPVPPQAHAHPGMAAPTPFMGVPKQVMSMAVPPPTPAPSSGAGAVALTEEQHFQDVFREFVATRDQCGEPQDGLTYDKFVAKLRKNKEQLVQKYACKTVRFQVYVKEGKAALKATPVKD
jgi:hypothetical protein